MTVAVMVTMKDKNKQASMESGGPLYPNLGPPFLQNTSVRQTKYQEEEEIIQHKKNHATNQTIIKTNNQNVDLPCLSICKTIQITSHGANLSVIISRRVKNNIFLTGISTAISNNINQWAES